MKSRRLVFGLLLFLVLALLGGAPLLLLKGRSQKPKAHNLSLSGPLLSEVQRGNTAEIKRLLAAGASPDARADDSGPLSVWQEWLNQLRGIKPKKGRGVTALGVAVDMRRLEAAEILLQHGADPETPYPSTGGMTPLMRRDAAREPKMARLLLRYGANPNARDNIGRTPLMYHAGSLEMMRILTQKGADVNAKTITGLTPLCNAVMANSPQSVKLLLKAGADVRGASSRSGNPLYWVNACFERNGKRVYLLTPPERKRMRALLVANGAKP